MHKEGHTNELKIRATTNKILVKLSFPLVPASHPVCAELRAASKPNKPNVRLRHVEKQRTIFRNRASSSQPTAAILGSAPNANFLERAVGHSFKFWRATPSQRRDRAHVQLHQRDLETQRCGTSDTHPKRHANTACRAAVVRATWADLLLRGLPESPKAVHLL